MRFGKKAALVAAMTGVALVLSACGPAIIRKEIPRPAASQTQKRIEAQGAESAIVRLRMGVGELKVTGGTSGLMDADFAFQPAEWEPEVRYSVEASRGVLEVRQPDVDVPGIGRRYRNEWDVRLGRDIPLDLTVECGVGESDLRLGELNLRTLRVMGGVGDTVVDLSGTPKSDVRVDIEAGVGSVTLKVPREAGVKIFGIHDGIGDWKAEGFAQRGENEAVNEAYDDAKVRYDIDITRGVGSVTIDQQ